MPLSHVKKLPVQIVSLMIADQMFYHIALDHELADQLHPSYYLHTIIYLFSLFSGLLPKSDCEIIKSNITLNYHDLR